MEQLDGKFAFITGGASGIGLGIARVLVDVGMKVMIADIRKDHLERALALFDSLGKSRSVVGTELDVTDRDGYTRCADAIYQEWGAVHVLVSNAGVGITGPVATATFDDWDWGLNVNLGGAVNALCTFLPRMIAQRQGGHIVVTSSLSAITPSPRNAAIYATAKAALMAMTEAMRDELADHGIGVSVLLPGPFKTNIREANRNRQPRYRQHSGYRTEEERLAAREDAPDWSDPLEAGQMVLDAIRANQLYVITHGEYRGWAQTKFEAILSAYPQPKDPERARAMGRTRAAMKPS
jgi:NAD(P)-dependent dehydrogenase (short-subunit alcohol dehydrogenase family)